MIEQLSEPKRRQVTPSLGGLNKMIKIRHIAITFLLVVLLTACISENATQPLQIDTPTQVLPSSPPVLTSTMTPSAVVSNTPSPTASLLPSSTTTPTVVNSPAVSSDARLDFKCIEIQSEDPGNMNSKGIIVFSSQANWHPSLSAPENSVMFIDNESDKYSHFTVSPNRTMIAYRKMILDNKKNIVEDKLVVANANSQILTSIPFQSDHWGNFFWLNNQSLSIRYFVDESGIRRWSGVQFVNPFSGKIEFGDWPDDVYLDAGLLPWDIPLVFDATQQQVAYPSSLDTGESTIALWDIDTQITLMEYPAILSASRDGPKWSPDSSRFILVMSEEYDHPPPWKQELFSIGRDGQLERLTYLTNYYRQVSISHLVWSPNGKYVAFWLADELSEQRLQEVAVLDIETGKVVNYCITEGETQHDANAPIWSPDSQQLLIVQLNSDRIARTIIVDIFTGSAFPIAENLLPEAWLLSSP